MKLDWQNWFYKKRFAQDWERAKKAAKSTPMEHYYDALLPEDMLLDDTPLVALDFESDGLKKDAQLLEAGWVRIIDRAVKLKTAQQLRIQAGSRLQEAAVIIHRITDDAAAEGQQEADVLALLLETLKGSAIVAHGAAVEHAFLNTACLRNFGVPFVGRFICTMHLEKRWVPKQRTADGLRLGKLRAQYGLPSYRAHDGLTDAIACGELFLAQCARRKVENLLLKDVLMKG
ncbi:DNA polymerase III subunit epsilon [Iodidimonas gelatinilytica]|uniref:DNA polymerase III subunit epsilon n=1 Tax=Iodidimonas gelatinilytica TaxID=1236966 RepID=A0A5A7N1T3_9PROT|nr:exonuclease domain-containing protein [Iodidimonas gelatinilytica]GER02232.1 DNA polymerase III subunit epsilon [Iodidimonas gelatinilytica]